MSLDKEGFLSQDAERAIGLIREKHRRRFELLLRVNKYSQSIKYRVAVFNKDGQQVIAACLMIKLLNDLQGAVMLLERGLGSQARSLFRVAIESLIIMVNACISEKFFKIYVDAGEKERLKLMRAMKNSPSPSLEDVRQHITEELIRKIAEEIKEANTRRETIDEWAAQANLEGLDNGPFRLFSQDIHSSPRAESKGI